MLLTNSLTETSSNSGRKKVPYVLFKIILTSPHRMLSRLQHTHSHL